MPLNIHEIQKFKSLGDLKDILFQIWLSLPCETNFLCPQGKQNQHRTVQPHMIYSDLNCLFLKNKSMKCIDSEPSTV